MTDTEAIKGDGHPAVNAGRPWANTLVLLRYLLTASLRPLPALNLGCFEAGI